MNEDLLRQALRDAAGQSRPTDAAWSAIVDEAERRSASRRGDALRRFRVLAAAATIVALAAAGVVALRQDHRGGEVRPIVVGVPSVTGGSSDLIVESGSITDEGGYAPVPADVATDVTTVDGVAQVVGVVRTIRRLTAPHSVVATPSVLVSWDGGDGFDLLDGRAPAADGEIALTPLAAQRLDAHLGDQIATDGGPTLVFVGVFHLPGGGPDVVLSAADLRTARTLAGHDGFTRLHVRLAQGADKEAVREGIVGVVPPGYRVVGVNQLGTTAQLRDELEIQQAYFDLMSADGTVRAGAVEGGVDDATSRANFEKFRDQAAQGTLRIQRFTFIDADHAEIVYAIYYGRNRSPMVHEPQHGMAVRAGGRWKLARTTLCGLADLVDTPCDLGTSAPPRPPDGWADPSSEPDLVAAFRTMADPGASLEERVAAVEGGADRRDVVRAGLDADQAYAGKVSLHISGVRRTAGGAEILYALQAEGDPPLETPYPVVAEAVRVRGRWQVADIYACGLVGIANQSCPARASTTSTTEPTTSSTETTAPTESTTTVPETAAPTETTAPG
jgi:hypothetical protein